MQQCGWFVTDGVNQPPVGFYRAGQRYLISGQMDVPEYCVSWAPQLPALAGPHHTLLSPEKNFHFSEKTL